MFSLGSSFGYYGVTELRADSFGKLDPTVRREEGDVPQTKVEETQRKYRGPAPDYRRQATDVPASTQLSERKRAAIRSGNSSRISFVQMMSRPRDRSAFLVAEGGLTSAPLSLVEPADPCRTPSSHAMDQIHGNLPIERCRLGITTNPGRP
jgi:hypothetical protein